MTEPEWIWHRTIEWAHVGYVYVYYSRGPRERGTRTGSVYELASGGWCWSASMWGVYGGDSYRCGTVATEADARAIVEAAVHGRSVDTAT